MNVVLTLFPQKMMYFISNIWSFTLIQFFNYLDAETSSLVDASQPRRVKIEFLPGHPNRTTHSHQERVRSCWLIYRAARLADTLDLDTHQEENSERPEDVQGAVKRELYTQGTLIMFKPFRAIEDLYDLNDNNWWQAYLRQQSSLAEDSNTVAIFGNMQNYYESFCRSGKNSTEPEFPNDVNVHHQRGEGKSDNEENTALDLLESEEALQNAEAIDEAQSIKDPLVSKLAIFSDSLFSVSAANSTGARVTFQQAKTAVSLLPKKNKKGFSLPGRARVDFETNGTLQNDQASEPKKARLDYFISTRVELLSKIEEALLQTNFIPCPTDGSAPFRLEANFPTMTEQSKHRTWNEKQHLTFVLTAAAAQAHFLK